MSGINDLNIADTGLIAPPFTIPQSYPSRTIKAVIERNRPAELAGIAGVNFPDIVITVANDPVTGICTAEQITSQNEFDSALIDTADDFLETFGEEIIYHPAGTVLDINLDTVELPVRTGETSQKRKIGGIIEQDAGMVKLAVR